MRVLLTGANGFIGRHVRARLAARGHEVVSFDLNSVTSSETEIVVGDVRDPVALDGALVGVDAVCHLAAKVGLGVDVQDTPDYADINVLGTAVVLAAMTRARVQRLVLASSMVVYGEGLGRCDLHGNVVAGVRAAADLREGLFETPCPRCGRPLRATLVNEAAPLDPRNAYAASKLAQEHFASSWSLATGATVAALRYHNVYGPGMPRDTPYAGVAAIFRSALLRGESPRVFEDGAQLRDFVHVRDVAAATVDALEQNQCPMMALNVGSGTPRTVGDMAAALADATHGPRPVVTGEFRLGDVRHITADSARIQELYGWRAEVDFAAGVAELLP